MKKNSQAFSLIETLMTLLLTTIGILGMVAMQGRGIQYTQDATVRTNAMILANALHEQIRISAKADANSSDITAYQFTALPTAIETAKLSSCKLADTAAKQVACWATEVRSLLPEATGKCSKIGNTLEIQLSWKAVGGDCFDSGNSTSTCTYRLQAEI